MVAVKHYSGVVPLCTTELMEEEFLMVNPQPLQGPNGLQIEIIAEATPKGHYYPKGSL
jgi:hypothetical protein